MKRRTKKDELLDVARKMPPLHHKLPEEKFDWKKSEVVRWLIEQPEILNYIWQSIYNRGEASCLVKFNAASGEWKGVDYHGD